MFGWLRRKTATPVEFADNGEAFAYACRECDIRLLMGAVIPALVEEEGTRGRDGERFFLLRLASRDGERRIWAPVLKESRTFPEVGDLVGFRVVTIASDLPEDARPRDFFHDRLLFSLRSDWTVGGKQAGDVIEARAPGSGAAVPGLGAGARPQVQTPAKPSARAARSS